MARLLTGKEVNDSMINDLSLRVEALKDRGIVPKLAIIRCGDNPSDLSYEKGAIKKSEIVGIEVEKHLFSENVTKEELISEIERLNEDESVHGVLIFRPLPSNLKQYQDEICNHLSPTKDVDGMTDISYAGVMTGKNIGFPPCTPEAVMKLLEYYDYDLKGKNVTVIGRSLVVGKPLALMLMKKDATVTVCHTKTVSVAEITKRADMIVTAAGVLNSLKREFVREGQTIVDVSINWDPSKKDGMGGIAGDAVFHEIEPVADSITPVPGGVGAITTVILIEHVVCAAEKNTSLL